MSWTQQHTDRIGKALHELKMAFLFEDYVEDKLDDLFESIERLERIMDYLETREN